MRTVNVHAAKTHLSSLLEAVQNGGEVIIAKAGKPIARSSGSMTSGRRAGQARCAARSGLRPMHGITTRSSNGCSMKAIPAFPQHSTRI